MKRSKKGYQLDEPLKHEAHARPRTRRDFIAQGLSAGSVALTAGSALSLFKVNDARADLSADVLVMRERCGIAAQGAGKIPFICFDLAGGANIAGSNVLVGGQGGQLDFLSTAGYSKQGLPGDMIPSITNPDTMTNDFVDSQLGLAFHADSGYLRGMLEKIQVANRANINGAVIAARSENDTGNNPHNPMYGINRAGANGSLLALCGSRSSESGGNSMAPINLLNPEVRPTKVDRPSDVTGLVDVGDLVSLLTQDQTVSVMESMYRISDAKLGRVSTNVNNPLDPSKTLNGLLATHDDRIKHLVRCGYVKSADLAFRFGDPAELNPLVDPNIVGPSGIFTADELAGDREFQKTASVMKMVINGFAGAGTITMGGYDYHTGDRQTGERRDLRAGRCMGACLEYAARMNMPLMMYVFSDGSVFSNGATDDSTDGRGKGVWTGDNQQTAGAFFLVYNPTGQPVLNDVSGDTARHQQLGFMRSSGDVETSSSPAANNVASLVDMVVLNYMALHGEQGQFSNMFKRHGLGDLSNTVALDRYIAFNSIVNGKIS